MANPLARVVMNSIAQKSGMVEKRSQGAQASNRAQSNGLNNLDQRETKLLSDLLNNNKSVTTGSSSYDKNTYGRSSNVSKASNTMKTLNSLVSGSTQRAENDDKKKECQVDRSRPSLKSLCSLDNISVGKSNINNDNRSVKRESRDVINALNLDDLVKGTSKSEKREVKSSKKQSGGMTTLGDLASELTKSSQKEAGNDNKAITTNNSFVKSKTVLNNLEAYIPKVTLESIGKKGSLF